MDANQGVGERWEGRKVPRLEWAIASSIKVSKKYYP